MIFFHQIAIRMNASVNSWMASRSGMTEAKIVLCIFFTALMLLQSPFFSINAVAAGEGAFDPRVVLDGLISTCGLVILVAGGALGVRMFFNGQMMQAVMAVLIAAFVFTLLNTAALRELGLGLKSFIWAGDSSSVSSIRQ